VAASTSHNPKGLRGLYRENFTYKTVGKIIVLYILFFTFSATDEKAKGLD
jgi:hypothetical protein